MLQGHPKIFSEPVCFNLDKSLSRAHRIQLPQLNVSTVPETTLLKPLNSEEFPKRLSFCNVTSPP